MILKINMHIFKDYSPSSSKMGDPGGGNKWIDFNTCIPYEEKDKLINHIIKHAKLIPYLEGIKVDEHESFSLPCNYGDEWQEKLKEIANNVSGFNPELKDKFINSGVRIFRLASRFNSNGNYIVGIETAYGLPILTVNEVYSILDCIETYETNDMLDKRLDSNSELIEYLRDPVTLTLFVKPVIASDGHTYSKETLQKIFNDKKNKPISPLTREPLIRIGKNNFLGEKEPGIPNILIQNILNQFIF